MSLEKFIWWGIQKNNRLILQRILFLSV